MTASKDSDRPVSGNARAHLKALGADQLLAAGRTWLLWGVCIAGIFLSYALVGLLVDPFPSLVEATLWIPWTLLGVGVSIKLARDADLGPRFDVSSLASWGRLALTVAIVLAVEEGLALATTGMGPNAANLVYAGVLGAVFAVGQRLVAGVPALLGIVAGLGVALGGVALAAWPPGFLVAGLVAAGVAGAGYGAVGWALMRAAERAQRPG